MNRKSLQTIALMMLMLALAGWRYPLSEEATEAVNWEVDYLRVKGDPGAFAGKTLLLGGRILEHRSGPRGTTLEVLCYELSRRDRPLEPDPACGRFLAQTPEPLDPERFAPGRLVTLTGTVSGEGVPSLQGGDASHPLFTVGEIYPWPLPGDYGRPGHWPRWCDDPFCDPFDPWRCRHRYPGRCCW